MKEKKLIKNKSVWIICCFLLFVSASCNYQEKSGEKLPEVKEVNLEDINPELFSEEEWYMPYYLKHFSTVANSVVDTGENRGYINISVWRGMHNHHTYNARIMEGILSLVWFYTTDRPWNVYFNDPALKLRIEAALDFWCNIQNEDGRFSEYGSEQWSLAPTAFAAKFVGRALWLLSKNNVLINEAVLERSRIALKKALFIGFTHEGLWEHGRNYTNQYANLWGGALMYLDVWPNPEIKKLLKNRLQQSMTEFQSPIGFFYEKGGPDWGYNLSTHHSDLQVTWEFAEGTEFEDMIIQKTKDWYGWFSYNAVKEPGGDEYYLNRAVETRQQKGYYLNVEMEDPARKRWTPQAEFVPEAHPFEMSKTEFKNSNQRLYKEMLEKYPDVAPLDVGDFRAFSPYAFLHHDMKIWLPTEEQKKKAINNLPYLKNENFVHVRHDNRSETTYSFIRKPDYYTIFNSGKIITDQQRYGLGLIWNPEIGTLFQSQSGTNDASYGTKANGKEQVYEAEDLIPQFKLDNQIWKPVEGNNDLANGEFVVTYNLGDNGKKTIHFKENKIVVQVEYSGNFTEILPLLISENDVLTANDNQITLQNEHVKLAINFTNSSNQKHSAYKSDLIEKKVQVFEISASDKLVYELVFPEN